MSDKPCEVCAGAQWILVVDELVQDAEGAWRWTKKRVPCPECTEEGQRWAEEEAAMAVLEEMQRRHPAFPAGVVIDVRYHDDE